jgi:hypothetical protein
MSRTVSLFLLVIGISLVAYAGAELYSWRAYPVVDHCQLDWSTGTETNLRTFVIERSTDATTYFAIGQVQARGSYSQYSFTDSSPLDADMERAFFYRLKMVDGNGEIHYSPVCEVMLSFSPVQHTWGSIKAMFR